MKPRYLLLIVLIVSLTGLSSTAAQSNPGQRHLSYLQENLALTDEQTTAISDILAAAHEVCASEDGFQQRRECMQGQRAEVDAEIAKLLTEEQQEAFSTLQEERQNRGPARRLEKLQDELGLSDEQAAQVDEIFSSARANCEEASSRRERRECMREQRDEIHQSLSEVLTEEQHEQLQQLRQQSRQGRGMRQGGCNCQCSSDNQSGSPRGGFGRGPRR